MPTSLRLRPHHVSGHLASFCNFKAETPRSLRESCHKPLTDHCDLSQEISRNFVVENWQWHAVLKKNGPRTKEFGDHHESRPFSAFCPMCSHLPGHASAHGVASQMTEWQAPKIWRFARRSERVQKLTCPITGFSIFFPGNGLCRVTGWGSWVWRILTRMSSTVAWCHTRPADTCPVCLGGPRIRSTRESAAPSDPANSCALTTVKQDDVFSFQTRSPICRSNFSLWNHQHWVIGLTLGGLNVVSKIALVVALELQCFLVTVQAKFFPWFYFSTQSWVCHLTWCDFIWPCLAWRAFNWPPRGYAWFGFAAGGFISPCMV